MANSPIVETQMMILKPVSEALAFIDPTITTKFRLIKSSGRLKVDKPVKGEWEMYNISSEILTKQIVPNKLISIECCFPTTTLNYAFTELTQDTTCLVIENYGFALTGDILIKVAMGLKLS